MTEAIGACVTSVGMLCAMLQDVLQCRSASRRGGKGRPVLWRLKTPENEGES